MSASGLPPRPPSAAPALDDPWLARTGSRDALSLALIEARNRLLLAWGGDASAAGRRIATGAGVWLEHWVNNNLQRSRGEAAAADAPRLGGRGPAAPGASGRPGIFGSGSAPPTHAGAPSTAGRVDDEDARADASAEDGGLRAWLQLTLEATLDLLAGAAETDAGLHFFRLALRHEDRSAEALGWLAHAQGRADGPPARAEREPVCFPGQRWWLGSEAAGCIPEAERWAHAVAVPEGEIDAQPVSWARFAEFAAEGGYDRRALWSEAGWDWAQAEGRRSPHGVARIAADGGVVLERGARLHRVHPQQPVLGVSRHEAEAWCRWAGRRLPTEPEWELAACTANRRGFAWGDVLEWVAGSARAWPGHAPVPGDLDPVPMDRGAQAPPMGVLRGASWMGSPRLRHPRARRFAVASSDTMPCGFRSCAC
jgi:gamma-glutamyl hercynylcysteine S-oxide synthase